MVAAVADNGQRRGPSREADRSAVAVVMMFSVVALRFAVVALLRLLERLVFPPLQFLAALPLAPFALESLEPTLASPPARPRRTETPRAE